jgi:nucleotide-binding universal stress UspA family protein
MKNIIAAIDFSDTTPEVLAMAEKMAKTFNARLHVLHTEPPKAELIGYGLSMQYSEASAANPFVGSSPGAEAMSAAEKADKVHPNSGAMKELIENINKNGVDAQAVMIEGQAAEVILETAKEIPADMIVIGTHEHGAFFHLIFGGVRDNIISEATCPVLVVPHKESKE